MKVEKATGTSRPRCGNVEKKKVRRYAMKLGELAFTCYIFDKIDDGDFAKFWKAVKCLDFNKDEDCATLIEYLNPHWGCRRPKVSHKEAGKKLKTWHKKWADKLFNRDKNLCKLENEDLDLAANAYEELLIKCKVQYVTKNGKTRSISFGPTTAAKILFILRPKALPPWDDTIKKKLIERKSINGHNEKDLYKNFLIHVKEKVVPSLREDCKKHGFELEKLPQELGGPDYITIPKLIDEYYWITITRKIVAPTREVLQRWLKWYNQEPRD